MVFCFMCMDDKPLSASEKEKLKGAADKLIVNLESNENKPVVSMKDACGLKCCLFCPLVYCGIPACLARDRYLKTMKNGIEDYECCQGACGGGGCVPECKGSKLGLCCEGLCCPVLSLSITRAVIMGERRLQPDPTDYQLMRCSNCLQMVSCCCSIAALIVSLTAGGDAGSAARLAANITEGVACCFTSSVGGCMYVQVERELDQHEKEKSAPTAIATPVTGTEKMER